jgi:Uncharacterized protein conserved in bacteria (DUF2325)
MPLPFAQTTSISAISSAAVREAAIAPLIVKDDTATRDLRAGAPVLGSPSARRTRIWEFGTNLHCSIIGTCLSTAELRHLLVKLDVANAAAASEHDVHCLGVMLAGRREPGAKLLQKALDRRHHAAVARFGRPKETAALLALWDEALKQGDVPGAYWATLTHPLATEAVVKRAFSDVHMLSHLVGAANRADIRRLRQLERENAELVEKAERQQRHLRDGFAERDLTIRRLREMLAAQPSSGGSARTDAPDAEGDKAGGDHLVQELKERLARETARCQQSEQLQRELSTTIKELRRTLEGSQQQCEALRLELAAIERQLSGLVEPDAAAPADPLRLPGLALLYVGGRAHQIPQLRSVVERTGASFLHHDGGIEHSSALLPGLVNRADHVLFPIDCISHDAASTIKRLCRAAGKSYEPLRTASLACLGATLMRISEQRETCPAR